MAVFFRFMDKNYDHLKYEADIYQQWEKSGAFQPKIDKNKKPFTIILPPPNASGRMHTGNILMIAIEDILVRWHRMMGDPTLWIPGTDHAGTETQITFERELKKQGKSRFNFDRQSLYQEIWKFVEANKELVNNQIRRMGASVDWSRYKFTLDPDVVEMVGNTFEKLAKDGLVYRGNYMVNYCPVCGTTYADIEIDHVERVDPLYYMKYGPFTLATVRPETKFGDTAVAINPRDKRYQEYVGQEIDVEGLNGRFKIKVIADDAVDPEFGTGVIKVTPAHDFNDYEMGKRHTLEIKQVIGLDGKLNDKAGKYAGLKVAEARKVVAEDLQKAGLMSKIDENYTHTVAVCKAGHVVEPTIIPNWFIKVDSLKKPAHDVVKKGNVKIYPKWRQSTYDRWMENMHDWAISRQNVWGIRIPTWYDVDKNPNLVITFIDKVGKIQKDTIANLLDQNTLSEIESGLQTLIAPEDSEYVISVKQPGERYIQETDTFDTWFSSGQWPLATLGYPDSDDFKYFYPTSVIETAWEILSKWVSRMIMFGMYLDGHPPFEHVYLHGIVRALDGRKMSKSLGNVINPEEYIEEFGVDALRMGLVAGTANGHDFNFPRDKVIGYRKFGNKLWNIGRFLSTIESPSLDAAQHRDDALIREKLNETIKSTNKLLEKFRFAEAADTIYEFVWHQFADVYIEKIKDRKSDAYPTLRFVFEQSLKLLHPFMPFVTEAIWQELKLGDKMLIEEAWPEVA